MVARFDGNLVAGGLANDIEGIEREQYFQRSHTRLGLALYLDVDGRVFSFWSAEVMAKETETFVGAFLADRKVAPRLLILSALRTSVKWDSMGSTDMRTFSRARRRTKESRQMTEVGNSHRALKTSDVDATSKERRICWPSPPRQSFLFAMLSRHDIVCSSTHHDLLWGQISHGI